MFESGELLIIFAFLIIFMKPEDVVRIARELGKAYRAFKKAIEEPVKPVKQSQRTIWDLLVDELLEEEEKVG